MQKAISASNLVNIQPGVISAAVNALTLNSIFLTQNLNLQSGQTTEFNSADAVAAFFGSTSIEAKLASIYFNGFDNSNIKPQSLHFANYNNTAVGAWLRGSKITQPLATVKTYTGDISVVIDGTTKTAANVNLSSATSFADVATALGTALSATVTYDATLQAFIVKSATTGATSTIDYATGTLADLLGLSQFKGAVTSQGAVAQTPATVMASITSINQNWALFMTTWEPDKATKQAFADWANNQNQRYAYVCWDSDQQATIIGGTSIGASLTAANYDGVILVYPNADTAAFICGAAASIDFNQHNGRITFAYRGQSGLPTMVNDASVAQALIANGYNFYGAYATATTRFNLLQPGQITGKWEWIDAYLNQIYLNASLQQAILTMLQSAKSVPYNTDGYGMINAACLDPITAAINFGSIRKGIPLSYAQAMEVNQAAGAVVSPVIEEQGYYLQILPASAASRVARTSPPMAFWYTDGGSIQKINLPSIDVM